MHNGDNGSAMVKGSVGDIAQRRGLTVAEAFMDARAVVLIDTSGTMGIPDAGSGRTRYAAACDELARLQSDMPGEVAVVSFSEEAVFCPTGTPINQGGGTDMAAGLRFVHKCDGLMRIIVIGDGLPDSESATLREAARFTSRIDCVFIGPEDSPGRDFMRRLAEATGGVSVTNEAGKLDLLGGNLRLLLSAGA